LLEVHLAYHHDAAKDQQKQKQQDEAVLPQEVHARFLRDPGLERNLELKPVAGLSQPRTGAVFVAIKCKRPKAPQEQHQMNMPPPGL
jgi:hypothetical protein